MLFWWLIAVLRVGDRIMNRLDPQKVKYIVIHHSESTGGSTDFIRYLHVDRNGWSDIGYHYIITNGRKNGNWKAGEDGEIHIGRDIKYMGAQARGHNHESVGICLIGSFKEEIPTGRQMGALIDLCSRLCYDYELPVAAILGHKDMPKCNTDCPEYNLYRALPYIRRVVEFNLWLRKIQTK